MASNQRIDEFLRLQDKGISLDEIASTLGVKPQTLRRNLNKNGYKSVNGKYIKDNKESINTSVQVSFVDNTLIKNEQNKKENKPKSAKKSSIEKKLKSKEDKVEKSPEKINNKKNKAKEDTKDVTKNKQKSTKVKKDRKINLTQEDLDKLCEVYDWYLEVRDCKSLKPKKQKKSIVIDFEETSDKTVNLKVDKGVWDDFLRLCSNSSYDRKTLVTQALYDFMKNHNDLL